MASPSNQTNQSIFSELFLIQKLQWTDKIAHAVKRSTKALNAIRLIRKFLSHSELIKLVTSNFYSILFYNSEIWHIPSLKTTLKQTLLSASAKALRICIGYSDQSHSFINIHKLCSRTTPDQMMHYKMALCLFKLFNKDYNSIELASLNFNHILTGRQ